MREAGPGRPGPARQRARLRRAGQPAAAPGAARTAAAAARRRPAARQHDRSRVATAPSGAAPAATAVGDARRRLARRRRVSGRRARRPPRCCSRCSPRRPGPGPGARWSGCPRSASVAAAEAGVALDRLALVPHPGPDWPTVVAALLDGVDIVVAAAPGLRSRRRSPAGSPPGPGSAARCSCRTGRGRRRPDPRRRRPGVARHRGAAGAGCAAGSSPWWPAVAARRRARGVTHLWLPRPTGVAAGRVGAAAPTRAAATEPATSAPAAPQRDRRERGRASAPRTLALWCPDWPVIAAEIVDGVPAHGPVAVLHANRVLACSPAARAEGVRRGLRKREAQGRCPQLSWSSTTRAGTRGRSSRWSPRSSELAPGSRWSGPGRAALAARGPARYYGGEEAAAERLVEHVAQACGVEAQVGVADGMFAAVLAARAGRVVAPGETAGVPRRARRRGPRAVRRWSTCCAGSASGRSASSPPCPPADVLARFGFDAALAHRPRGGRGRPAARAPAAAARPDGGRRRSTSRWSGSTRPRSPPGRSPNGCTQRSPGTAWPAPGWASRRAPRRARSCTGSGGTTGCSPRRRSPTGCAGSSTAGSPAPAAAAPARPTAGIVRLRLVPDGVLAARRPAAGPVGRGGGGARAGAPGADPGAGPARARRRAGPRCSAAGGRRPSGAPGAVGRRADARRGRSSRRGRGGCRRPPRRPCYPEPLPAAVCDRRRRAGGGQRPARGDRAAGPGRRSAAAAPVEVVGWAGPWPVDERWWAPAEAHRCGPVPAGPGRRPGGAGRPVRRPLDGGGASMTDGALT